MTKVTKEALWRGIRARNEHGPGRTILSQPHLAGLPIVALEKHRRYLDVRVLCQHVSGQVIVLVEGPHEQELSDVHVILWESDFGDPAIAQPEDEMLLGDIAEILRRHALGEGSPVTVAERAVIKALPTYELVES